MGLKISSILSNEIFQPVKEVSEEAPQSSAQDEDAIVFSDPYVDPATGDWILSKFDIECIAIGAGIVGCGGGGSPYLGRLRALKLIKNKKEIRVVHPNRYVEDVDNRNKAGVDDEEYGNVYLSNS